LLEKLMPLLTYSNPPFTPNTVIRSALVNAKYTDIQTLLNTTKLDDVNLQDAGITRSSKLKAGTPSYVIVNDTDGKMSEVVALAPSQGGTGLQITPTSGDAGKVLQVGTDGNFELAAPPESPGTRLYVFNRFR
jgi:hypothetical protein